MKLDQPAAIDGPQQTRSTGTVERTVAAAAEQGHGVPTQCGGALGPATGGQELGAASHELTPTVRGDVGWWAALAQMANALDPTGGDARCRFGRRLDYERGGLLLQHSEPFARRSESVANRSPSFQLTCAYRFDAIAR